MTKLGAASVIALCVATAAIAASPRHRGGSTQPSTISASSTFCLSKMGDNDVVILCPKKANAETRFLGAVVDPLTASRALVASTIIANGRGLITGPVLNSAISSLYPVFQAMGSFNNGLTWTPSIPNGTITQAMFAPGAGGNVTIVPTRVITTFGPTPVSATDYLVCLNGPNEVDLEASPPIGTTHILKDCRTTPAGNISVVAATGDTIDGASAYTLQISRQSINATYTAIGWEIY